MHLAYTMQLHNSDYTSSIHLRFDWERERSSKMHQLGLDSIGRELERELRDRIGCAPSPRAGGVGRDGSTGRISQNKTCQGPFPGNRESFQDKTAKSGRNFPVEQALDRTR